MPVHHLATPPRLAAVLARGALASPAKRGPYDEARLPEERLVLDGAYTDPDRLRAYARVCGFPVEDVRRLPPSYPHVLGFPLAMQLLAARAFPFPLLGLVHTGIELTQQRALRAEERPEISVLAENLAPHRRGSSFDVLTEARVHGQLMWHSRSTYLCKHRTAEPAPHPSPEGAYGQQRPAPLPVGAQWELPAGLGRRYAAASGDRNPIHLHPLTAKLFGFRRQIAHGMWTFARCLAETGPVGEQLTARAEFTSPLLLPATVTYGADEPTASAGAYRAPVRVHRFELRSTGRGADRDGHDRDGRVHLTGEVTSARPA